MITYIQAAAGAAGTGSVIPEFPSSRITDDVVLLFTESCAGEAVTLSGTDAAAFNVITNTPIIQGSGLVGTRFSGWWARSQDLTGSVTVDDPGDHIAARMVLYRGCRRTGSVIHAVGTGTRDTAPPDPTTWYVGGVTTTKPNVHIIVIVAWDKDSSSNAGFGYTDMVNDSITSFSNRIYGGTVDGNGGGLIMKSGRKIEPGLVDDTQIIADGTYRYAAATIALEPPDELPRSIAPGFIGV